MIELKDNNHIDETKLDKRESLLFIQLLDDEKTRHLLEVKSAKFLMWLHRDKLISKFWELQMLNHESDIEMIEKTMMYLFEKWRIPK